MHCSINSVAGECHDKRISYRAGRAGASCGHRYGGFGSCCPVCDVGGLVRNAGTQTERLCGDGCRQITGSRAICAHGTDSSGGLGDGTSVVALSAAAVRQDLLGPTQRKMIFLQILAAPCRGGSHTVGRHGRGKIDLSFEL
jgi:hypothetical protein